VRRPTVWILTLGTIAAALATTAATPPNLDRALEAQRQLAAERPGDASVFNDLGNLLTLAADAAGAEDAYRRAVELAPERVAPRYNLALLVRQRGRNREALDQLQAVVELVPEHAWAHYQIGAIYDSQGEDRRAIRAYARAFSLDPQLAFAETNPQVIDNRLLSEALLRAYRDEGSMPRAPKIYEDPARIAGLLLPPVPTPDPEAADGDRMAGQEAAQPATLSGADLEGGAVNQASPQGAYRPPGSKRQEARSWTTRQGQVGRVDSGQEAGTTMGVGVQGGVVVAPGTQQGGTEGTPRVVVPPGSVRYRPGTTSTGRLDLELIPDAPAPAERAG
jgi:hypothetical protein